ADLPDRVGEALRVGLRQVALERRGLDLVDRQDRDDRRLAAERLPVAGEDGAAVAFDLGGELGERGVAALRGREALRSGRGALFRGARLAGRPRGGFLAHDVVPRKAAIIS